MASTYILLFTITLQPFNRFSSDFHQRSWNIFPTYRNLLQFQCVGKQIWSPKWRPPRYLCLLYLFNRSTDFHQIFNKNLEIYCLIWICYNFNNGRKQNGLQNGVHLDICVYYISSTILLIFIKFSQKPRNIFPTYGNLL